MTVTVNNILQRVQTYNESNLEYMYSEYGIFNLTNKKFKDFQNISGQLGQTTTFDLPLRFNTVQSLVWSPQSIQQRVQSLTVDTAWSSSAPYTAQEFIYNLEYYIGKVGMGMSAEIGANIEQWLALNFVSGVPVMTGSPNPQPTGALHTESGPYLYVGKPNTPVNSVQQLAQFATLQRNYGAAKIKHRGIISDIAEPQIVGTMLNQFVKDRNEEAAKSWHLGEFSQTEWYTSSVLPIHTSGNTGEDGTVLTVVSTNDPTGANITQITFSGAAASDANAVFSGNVGSFKDGVASRPNLRYLRWLGRGGSPTPSANPVQIRALSSAGADGSGNVIVDIYPALCSQSGNQNQNILHNIVAGMQFVFEASHKAGYMDSGDAFYLAMPVLPEQRPFDTSSHIDPETGVGLRMTYGSILGQNQTLLGLDCITGSVAVPEYGRRILFPLNQ